MSDVTAGFGCEDKSRWDTISPDGKGFFLGQLIEGVIDFHGLEISGIVPEEFFFGQGAWIEGPLPMRVVPTGSTNMDLFR